MLFYLLYVFRHDTAHLFKTPDNLRGGSARDCFPGIWPAAWHINRITEPVYEVSGAYLLVGTDRSAAAGMAGFFEGMELFNNRMGIQNQQDVLQSFSLNRRVMDQLDFDITYVSVGNMRDTLKYQNAAIRIHPDEEFRQLKDHPVYITVLSPTEYRLEINDEVNVSRVMQFGETYKDEKFNFSVTLVDPGGLNKKYYVVFNDRDKLANHYREKLEIELNDRQAGSIFYLSSSGKNARQEADYINKLMEMFILMDLEEKNQVAVNTIDFIDNQLVGIIDSLNMAEKALQDFQSTNQLANLSREGGIIFTRLERFQSEKVELSVASKYFEYLENYMSGRSTHKDVIAPSAIGISDPLLNSLIGQVNQLHAERNKLEFSVQENNPRIRQLDHLIENVTATLLENVRSMREANNIALEDVEARLAGTAAEINKLPRIERHLLNIERRFSLSNDLYTYLMEKRAEASIARAASISDSRIIDRTRYTEAEIVSPRKTRNYAIGLLFGLGFPFLIIVLAEFFNHKIPDKTYLEKHTRVNIIGNIVSNKLDTELPTKDFPKSAITESFRSLRTNIMYLVPHKETKVISFTSTVGGEGKTFCAANFATILAKSGKKTLLLGLDLRKPKNSLLMNRNGRGISTFLVGQYSESEIVEKSEIENLDVVSAGAIPPNPAELLQLEKMDEFINRMKEKYEYIVLDNAPAGLVTDAFVVSRFADMTILLVRQDYSNRNVLEFINELHNKKEIKNLGILLNDVKASGSYGYGYGYGYGNGNGNGYYEGEQGVSYLKKLKKSFKT